ncbi:MAG: GerMN domain-containing protein [Bacillota bacterium]|nr:GerMN domain-containing protein [Bacillota bacterium]
MRRGISILLALCLFLPLYGCKYKKKAAEAGKTPVELTYIRKQSEDSRDDVFLTVNRLIDGDSREILISKVLGELNTAPAQTCQSPFQNGIKVLSSSVEGNCASVDLSSEFNSQTDIEKSLIAASLVQSLCSIEGIDYVKITSELEPLEDRLDRYFSQFDFVLSDDVLSNVRYETTVYFPDIKQNKLLSNMVTIKATEDGTLEQAVIAEIIAAIRGKKGNEDLIPKGTRLISTEVKNAVCYLNFSEDFLKLDDKHGMLVLFSFIDSVCRLQYIESVQFMIDGKLISDIGGVNTDQPIKPDYKLVLY